jgi:hypothetical protein
MRRLIFWALLLGGAYWAGAQGLTHVDVLEWLERHGLMDVIRSLFGESAEWTEQQNLEQLPEKLTETVEGLKGLEQLPEKLTETVEGLKDKISP